MLNVVTQQQQQITQPFPAINLAYPTYFSSVPTPTWTLPYLVATNFWHLVFVQIFPKKVDSYFATGPMNPRL